MNILYITATRIGDAVLSTGVLAELHRRHPDAGITVACGPLAQSLFEGFPGVVRVIAMTKRPFAGHWIGLWREVRRTAWDLVVDLRRSLVPYLISARERRTLAATDDTMHRVEFLATVLGSDAGFDPVIPLPPVLEKAAAERLGQGPVIAIAPVAARPEKTWPVERFVALAGRLVEDGARLLIVGGPEDAAAASAFARFDPIPVLAEPDLKRVAALLGRARLFVGNDSGTAHLAAAAGAPTLTLFGPTEPRHYAPRGPRARIVVAPGRQMSNLDIETVLAAARELSLRELSLPAARGMERP